MVVSDYGEKVTVVRELLRELEPDYRRFRELYDIEDSREPTEAELLERAGLNRRYNAYKYLKEAERLL